MSETNVSPLNESVAIRQEIEAAAKARIAIRIFRGEIEEASIDGFVAATGSNFFAVELISDAIYLDGFVCLRFKDVSSVVFPAPNWPFKKAALSLRDQQPKDDLTIDCETLSGLLRSVPETFGLVSVHTEIVDPDVCYVGKIANVDEDKLTLSSVSPDAKWHDQRMEFRLSEVTRVDFGGSYEDALFQVLKSNQA